MLLQGLLLCSAFASDTAGGVIDQLQQAIKQSLHVY